MEMIDAMFPQTLPAGQALGMSQPSPVVGGVAIEGEVTGIAPGLTRNLAGTALPLLFEMVLMQLAGANEADTNVPDAAEAQTEPSPGEMSVLASLVPALIFQVEPQPTMTQIPAAVLAGGATPQPLDTALTIVGTTEKSMVHANANTAASLVPTAPSVPTEPPVLSSDAGKDLKTAPLLRQALVTGETQSGPQRSMSTLPAATLMPTQEPQQPTQTISFAIPAPIEVKNPSGGTAARDADAGQALSPGLTSAGQKSEQPPAPVAADLLMSATLQRQQDDSQGLRDILKGASDKNAALDITHEGIHKIPGEFLVDPAPAADPLTEATTVPKTAVIGDAIPASLASRDTIHLQLAPSDLGRVTLHVSVQSQQVQATVGVEHRGLGELLAASQGVLNDAMRQHGLRLEELHIESIGNPGALGAEDGRAGLLNHGHPGQDAQRSHRQPMAPQGLQSEASIPPDMLESFGPRHRINLFA